MCQHSTCFPQHQCPASIEREKKCFLILVSFFLFSFAGYITRGCSQPKEVDLTLKVLVSAAPVVLIITGLIILYFYPIDEKRRQGNRKLLQEMR